MRKDDARRLVKARKRMLDEAERSALSGRVMARLEREPAFADADRILMYHSLPDEVSTHDFLLRWDGRKRLFLPRVNGEDLDVLPYDRAMLRTGAYGIGEPSGHSVVPVGSMDLIVVPAVAYDLACRRVGRGKGYYDRLLSGIGVATIGVAFDCQVVDEIEAESHDVPVDMVITESATYIRR